MAADIINLSAVRKRRQRDEARKQAAENRVKFGSTKKQKTKQARERASLERSLDGKRLEKGDEDSSA